MNAVGTLARFNDPQGIATDGTNLYVADTDNNMIRKISLADFTVTTLAGSRSPGLVDSNTGTLAHFDEPKALTILNGKAYVVDQGNYAIRSVDLATGAVKTVVGGHTFKFPDGAGKTLDLSEMTSITSDGTDLYVSLYYQYVIARVVLATGEVRLLAGKNGDNSFPATPAVPIETATFDGPTGLAWSATDSLIVGSR